MILNRRALLHSAGALSLASSVPAFAQGTFPSKPAKLIVPFPPGGANDIVGRLLAPRMGAALGHPVVIENKGGAGGAIGAQAAARSDPDGHTILVAGSTHIIQPLLVKEPGFDWRTDFTPVTRTVEYPLVLVVHPSVPARTMPEFLAYARAKGSDLFFGSAGNGSTQHLVGELFNSMAGTKMKHVPYRGNGPASAALLAGDIQVFFDIVTTAVNLGGAGKVRPLAVTSMVRNPALPNLPTLHEAGVANFEATPWQCLLLPKGASPAVVQKWLAAARHALADKDVKAQLLQQGIVTLGTPPEELAAFMQQESAKWGKVIADAGIKGDS